MRDGHKDNHALDYYMKDDTPMCEPHQASYVQGYHRGYHDQKPINSYFYPNHNPIRHYPHSRPHIRMPHPSRHFKIPEPLTEEMIRELMDSQMKANEVMKNQGDIGVSGQEDGEDNAVVINKDEGDKS
ncbi:hypothetical protein Tco_0327405 [Tanacetum coccineum]